MTRGSNVRRRAFLESLIALPCFLYPGKNWSSSPSWITPRPRRYSRNVFIRNGKPLLVIVEGKDLKAMLETGLEAIPEFEVLLKNKKRIALKPNATAPEVYPVTTDVDLLSELIRKIKQVSTARLTVVDSTSYAGLAAHRVFSKLGYFGLRDEDKVRVFSIDPTVASDFVKVHHSAWKRNPSLLTNKLIQDSDAIINLAVPKRHHVADFTCALKNNFGCTYDTFRMSAHANYSKNDENGSRAFDESLVEFADAVRSELTIVDARSLLTRSGPTFRPGRSEIKGGVNRLIISGDMVAMDSYCADLMAKYDETFEKEKRVRRLLDYASTLGLGTNDLGRVEMVEITA
jgi:uncharacterized protein (DUF362 family)